jgi:TPP-dependent pyruvate/acetoin dehydrogenase alpha subunit
VTRLGQHTSQVGDTRGPEDLADARRHDPIPRFGRYLRHHAVLDDALEATFRERAKAEVADAVAFAGRAAGPPVERAFADVYGKAISC